MFALAEGGERIEEIDEHFARLLSLTEVIYVTSFKESKEGCSLAAQGDTCVGLQRRYQKANERIFWSLIVSVIFWSLIVDSRKTYRGPVTVSFLTKLRKTGKSNSWLIRSITRIRGLVW